MKKAGEYVYLRGHGCGQISHIEEKEIGGDNIQFYIVKLPSGMQVMYPTNSPMVRGLTDQDTFKSLITNLNKKVDNPDNSTWNRRHRTYMEQLKSLDPNDISQILREINSLKDIKKLSFGERKMMEKCIDILASEGSPLFNMPVYETSKYIQECLEKEV